ncbi:STE3-domain-containing protein [Dichomitus squalens LYAD-421 SS1]|uniref:STE3-domain-containing protein n=1 Tax=Dichomitus squalens (strain LYAD-421) TaxID=732165 RepID=R7SSR8_DICSQ|nr:STE3-domain-containing protein [Dichomitus squalens LYAD-421 SS1]EJF59111.1 STE3-domain-containing protein [Dichomitus squalens LYAD-421 SS1]
MRAELPVVSFLCLGLLVLLSPVWLHTRNAAVISLAAWLFCCNVIHGINALLWAGSVAIRSPVWCDVVTRVLLASQLALPGCALALARRLRRCAIGQEVSQKAHTFMQDLTFSLILPVLYIILHVIVQSHRFDIVEDFGCFASIDTSTVSIIVIWIPPLAICITTVGFAFLAVRGRLDSGLVVFSHMSDSPHLNIFAFLRPLITSLSVSLISFSITIFSIYARVTAIDGIEKWTIDTWSVVHAHVTEVSIVSPTDRIDLVRTEVEWWMIPACSFVFILITLTGLAHPPGSDSWRGYKVLAHWFRFTVLRQRLPDRLPLSSKDFRPQALRSEPSSPSLIAEVKSQQGDTWRPSQPTKVKLTPLTIPERPASTFELSTSPDDPFVKSTLDYVGSPTGREALALPHMSIPVPPAPRPSVQRKAVPPSSHDVPRSVSSSPQRRTSSPQKASRRESLLAGPWPRPPSTVVLPDSPRTPSPKSSSAMIAIQPPSPASSAHDHAASPKRPPSVMSATPSFASSTMTYGSFFDDSDTNDTPFQEHLADLALHPELAVPRHLQRVRSRDKLPRSFGPGSRRRNGSDGLSGGIYMTVVKETV